jgi:hypothetical protein
MGCEYEDITVQQHEPTAHRKPDDQCRPNYGNGKSRPR